MNGCMIDMLSILYRLKREGLEDEVRMYTTNSTQPPH